jgi:endonuclease/exonuclease/phosphatase family metal-dependent hydrolase
MCDCNLDYRADRAVREPGFLADAFAGRAVSSYQALGLAGLRPSHDSGRFIDYVFLAASEYRREAEFRSQATLGGYDSDHRPVLARIVLH